MHDDERLFIAQTLDQQNVTIISLAQRLLSMESDIAFLKEMMATGYVEPVAQEPEVIVEEINQTLDQVISNTVKQIENSGAALEARMEEQFSLFEQRISTPTITYEQLKQMVLKQLGFEKNKEQGWRSAFINASEGYFSEGSLTKWRKTDQVPLGAIRIVEMMDQSHIVQQRTWTAAEIDMMYEYFVVDGKTGEVKLIDGYTFEKVASELGARLGVPLVANSVKSRINGLRVKIKKEFFPD